MSLYSAKWFFILGTAVSAVLFLALTVDTQRQVVSLTHVDKLTDQVVAGKWVFEKHNCNDCHTILGFGGYYAPDLTRAYYRLGAANIKQIVAHPEVVFADDWRKMANLHLSDKELDDLVVFLEWVSNIDNQGWPPQDQKYLPAELRGLVSTPMSPGLALLKTKGCLGCHSIGGTGGRVGPAFDHVGSEMTAAQIEAFVPNPQAVRPKSPMPPQKDLTPGELKQIAEFLAQQR